ncbi:helix-turn-helix protein [Chitinophaga niastensis]|uniref:Helix-turn-helix protein n=1 Tax=Chitinophaga niastensis TaxID=536980 RepID=A0A2P8HAS1_CHINA|nr:helix-turn-helix transcriptional regulator [Chitinophaga niastensis]PSL43326.1 helix-turn-helix protein [Chitinophaga niastensis]
MTTERYSDELIKLGKRLQQLRKERKLTQMDMEVRSGINNGDISRIENGQKNIEFHSIVKLAAALEVELYQLFPKCD